MCVQGKDKKVNIGSRSLQDSKSSILLSWNDLPGTQFSEYFGINPDGGGKDAISYYKTSAADRDKISFDISNNRIIASATCCGLVKNAGIVTGLEYSKHSDEAMLRGVTALKHIQDAGPWGFSIALDGGQKVNFHDMGKVRVDLLGGFFPVFSTSCMDLSINLVSFAPTSGTAQESPRALIQALKFENKGKRELAVGLRVEGNELMLKDASSPVTDAKEAVLLLDSGKWDPSFPNKNFKLAAGDKCSMAFAFIIGENCCELERTANELSENSSLSWFNMTWEFHASRFGQLTIPGGNCYAEALVRMSELCRQSPIYMADGQMGGTFIGSNYTGSAMWTKNIWNKDSFYQLLPMSMLEPKLCADSISFFLKWAVPLKAYGRGLTRFEGAPPEIHSLSLSMAPFILSGAYYQMTGDKDFFRLHPEILDMAKKRFEAILSSRRKKDIFLFNSMYISDGDARGEFHTGSNLIVWYSFDKMSLIAREAYGDTESAVKWAELARRVKSDLQKHCIGESAEGRRYFEGVESDGKFVEGHDGEESDVALMPFYGFAEPDDPALTVHSRLCLSELNPLYKPAIDGVIWVDGDWERQPITFPAWTTAMAGAMDEKQTMKCLERIRRLTDVDGSIWWWPYENKETDHLKAGREPVKCGWAAGVYLCRFINDILGLRIDLPAHRISFRPFCPWESFSWKNCRLGSSLFNIEYLNSSGKLRAQIENCNNDTFTGVIELVLPEGKTARECLTGGKSADNLEKTVRYGRSAIRFETELTRGRPVNLEIIY